MWIISIKETSAWVWINRCRIFLSWQFVMIPVRMLSLAFLIWWISIHWYCDPCMWFKTGTSYTVLSFNKIPLLSVFINIYCKAPSIMQKKKIEMLLSSPVARHILTTYCFLMVLMFNWKISFALCLLWTEGLRYSLLIGVPVCFETNVN